MCAAIVIAHRGASGYLPEHTLASKALAHGLGADFLEQDVVASRDAELVVLHDIYLDDVTDVAVRFPARHRDDGHYYVIDFDLAELRSLAISERRNPATSTARFGERFPVEHSLFRIVTLDEELQLIHGLNKTMGRRVGIYPEIKHPRWHAQHGIDLSRLLLGKLAEHGYRHADDPVYVQCFDAAELRRVRHELDCKLRLVQLVGTDSPAELLSARGLRGLAGTVDGLGPSHSQLVCANEERVMAAPLLAWTRDAGLCLHPYTFRRDDLPPYASSLDELLDFFVGKLGVDGVFTDHPDVGARCRDRWRAANRRDG